MIGALVLLFILFFLPPHLGAQSMPSWVQALPLMQWHPIPNTALSGQPSYPCSFANIPGAKISDWVGATLKRSGSTYIIAAAGGHGDYCGNEVNALTLNATTPAWTELISSSLQSQVLNATSYYLDLRPTARHTYWSTQFDDSKNKVLLLPSGSTMNAVGAPSPPPGWPYDGRYGATFSMSTNAWGTPTDIPSYPGPSVIAGAIVTKHQITNDVYFHAGNGWFRLNSSSNTWVQLTSSQEGGGYAAAGIDPLRGRILLVGSFNGSVAPRVRDLNGAAVAVTFGGLGGGALPTTGYPGIIYDEVNDKYLVLYNSGGNIEMLRVDPATWIVDAPTITGTKPAARTNGIQNSVQYVPELGGLVMANSYTGNVQFMRLSTAASTLSSILTTLTLTSTLTQSNAPFSVGHVFKQGDIPAGQTITSPNVSNFQATIKNTWPDGSARFAILAGRTNLTANTPFVVQLKRDTAPGGAALTEANLTATGITASVQVGATCTVNLSSLIGVASTLSAGRWTSGRVRTWVSGPQMSSWIYYSRCGSDAHITVWFEVRLFAGGAVEVLPWVENSTLNVAAPVGKAAQTITFTLGGTQRFTQSLGLPHHTRFPLASGSTFTHWLGTNPAVTPKHDVLYLQQTKMVPTYRGVTPSTGTIWTRLIQVYTPGQAANQGYTGMGSTGSSASLLSEHDVAYLSSGGDPRALASVIANGYAAGGFDIHFRDETTNQAARFSSYPTLVIGSGCDISSKGVSSTDTTTPAATGTAGGHWTLSHHPSFGYFPYLITGRFYFLEEIQLETSTSYLILGDTRRQGAQGVVWTNTGEVTTRGAAWVLRDYLQAALATPDGETLQTEYKNSWQFNIDYYHNKYVANANNPQGFAQPYSQITDSSAYSGTDDPYYTPYWMEDFFTLALGFGADANLAITTTHQTKLAALYNWKAQSNVMRFGDGSPSNPYHFTHAVRFAGPAAPENFSDWDTGAGPWFASWGALWTALKTGIPNPSVPHDPATLPCCTSTDNNLQGASGSAPNVQDSYWGFASSTLAYAVTLGYPGAQAAYNRFRGADNISALENTFAQFPTWSIMPSITTTEVVPPSPSGKIIRVGSGKTFRVGVQ